MEEILDQKKKEMGEVDSLVLAAKQKLTAILNAINTDEQIKERVAGEILESKESLAKAQSDFVKASSKLDGINLEISNAVAERDTIRKDISSLGDKLAQTKIDTTNAIAELAISLDDYRKHKNAESDEMDSNLQILHNRINDKTTLLAQLENSIVTATSNKAKLESELRSVEESLKLATSHLDERKKSSDVLSGDIVKLKAEIEGLSVRESEAKAKLADLNKSADEAFLEVAGIKAEIERTNVELATKRNELSAASNKVIALLDRQDSLNRKEIALKSKYEQAGLVYPID